MIEPAAWGIPTISGPYMHNFATVADLLKNAGGLAIAADAVSLSNQIKQWLLNDKERQVLGQRARAVAKQNSGALQRLLEEIDRLMPSSGKM
ncbi:hypothetical protein P3339_02085 [Microbulbifer sp. MLAF003]|nr:hypothetical protein [Microbulbifer sp. MLAF003]WHI51640.1 hypothetical protein P3339_02085 [Microbulbifer sp. MLAF003]